MLFLVISSLIFSLSFSISKNFLSVFNPFVVAEIFCLSSSLFFLPFFRFGQLRMRNFFRLLWVGAIQFGVMYTSFQASLYFLKGHEVALLLLPTPIYLTILDAFFSKNWSLSRFLSVVVITLSVTVLMDFSQQFCFQWQGVILTQICNVSFAAGQFFVKKFFHDHRSIIHYNTILYFGAALVCLPFAIYSYHFYPAMCAQDVTICMLYGIICCGFSHWFWNIGAVRVSTTILAIMNNLQIPLAIIVSVLIFGERIDYRRFIYSLMIIAAMFFVIRITEKKI